MKNLFILLAATSSIWSTTSTGAELTSFCGKMTALSFTEFYGRIHAYGYMEQIKNFSDRKPLEIKRIIFTDPKVVFKLAKGISQTTIQNPKQLQEDLKRSQFNWDHTVGDELHPNPYEEDFEACLRADLTQLDTENNLRNINEILDLKEDGHSIIDLLN